MTSAQHGVPGGKLSSWTGIGPPGGEPAAPTRSLWWVGGCGGSVEVGDQEREDLALRPGEHRTEAVRPVERLLQHGRAEVDGTRDVGDEVVRGERDDPVRGDLGWPLAVDLCEAVCRVAVLGAGRRPPRAV